MLLGTSTTAHDGALAAFPDWRLTITQGAATVTVGAVASSGVPAALRKVGLVARQARQGGRGRLSFVLANVPDPSTGTRLSDTFPAATAPLEGAQVELHVEAAPAIDAVLWRGTVQEVRQVDHATLELDALEHVAWLDEPVAEPLTTAAWPLLASQEAGKGAPLALGQVADAVPALVRRPPESVLTSALTSGETAAQVADTTGWPASGSARIGEEELTYASLTPTSLEGLVRPSPTSHAAGEPVVEGGELVYLVSTAAVDAVTNLRLDLGDGLTTVADPGLVTVDLGPPATVTLAEQPLVEAGLTEQTRVCIYDLDTVGPGTHPDVPAAEVELCLGGTDGFKPTGHCDLEADFEYINGQRAAPLELPAGATLQRAFVVVEAEGHSQYQIETTSSVGPTGGIPVSDIGDIPATAGRCWLGVETGAPELITYINISGLVLNAVRGVNSGGVGQSWPAGTSVTFTDTHVAFDLAGGNPDFDADALGPCAPPGPQAAPPESVQCKLQPSSHGFSLADHSHTIDGHTHGWDSEHGHVAGTAQRVDAYAVAVKLGVGGPTGAPPDGMGVYFPALPMVAPAVSDFHGIDHDNLPAGIPGGFDTNQWWACLFPSFPFQGDTRKLLAADFFLAVSGAGGGVKVVTNGAPVNPNNPTFAPLFTVTSYPTIPPEAEALGLSDGLIAQPGLHGTWRNRNAVTAVSPATGGDLEVEPQGTVVPLDVWGEEPGTDLRGSPPMEAPGYLELDDGGGTTEWVRFESVRWGDAGGTYLVLEDITRGAYGSTASAFSAAAGIITKYPTIGHYACRWQYAGVGQYTGVEGRTCAQLNNNPGDVHLYQTELGRVFEAHASSKEPALFDVTVEQFFVGRVDNPAPPSSLGSLLPFNYNVASIWTQWGGTIAAMPVAPILWVRAHTGLNVHAAWCEIVTEGSTSDDVADDGLDEDGGEETDDEQSLRVSNLSWFEVTDQVAEPADLVGATVEVIRQESVWSLQDNDARNALLRVFYVLEVVLPSATERVRPQRLVVDVTGPDGAAVATQAIERLVEYGLGQTPASVLDLASFTAAEPSTQAMAAYLRDPKATGRDVVEIMAEQGRLVTRWDDAGLLEVVYLEDRGSLPAPSVTFTEDDVALDSLVVRRGRARDRVGRVEVRGRYTDLSGYTLTGAVGGGVGPATPLLELDAPHLIDQAGVDDLAAHVVDYGQDVSVRVGWDTFTQGAAVLPGDTIGLTHTEYTSSTLLVEAVELNPSDNHAAFVRLECRDLAT